MDLRDPIQLRLREHLQNHLRQRPTPVVARNRQVVLRVPHQRPLALDLRFVSARRLRSSHDSKALKALRATVEGQVDLRGVPQEDRITGLPQKRIATAKEAPALLRQRSEVVLVIAGQATPTALALRVAAVLRHEHLAVERRLPARTIALRELSRNEPHTHVFVTSRATARRRLAAAQPLQLLFLLGAQATTTATKIAERRAELFHRSALGRLVRGAALRRVATRPRATALRAVRTLRRARAQGVAVRFALGVGHTR